MGSQSCGGFRSLFSFLPSLSLKMVWSVYLESMETNPECISLFGFEPQCHNEPHFFF